MSFDIMAALTVFGSVFLTELGDKTQLAAFSLASTTRRPLTIFAASSAAFFVSSLLAAVLGSLLSTRVEFLSSYIAPVLFIAFGLFIFFKKEAPAIYGAFAEAAKTESLLSRRFLKELERRGLMNGEIKQLFDDEKTHEDFFRLFIKKKFLFDDNINDNAELLKEHSSNIAVADSFKKLSDAEFIKAFLRLEEASMAFYAFLLDHMKNNKEHEGDSMTAVLEKIFSDEQRHVEICKKLLKGLGAAL
jgi:hypothetical protein